MSEVGYIVESWKRTFFETYPRGYSRPHTEKVENIKIQTHQPNQIFLLNLKHTRVVLLGVNDPILFQSTKTTLVCSLNLISVQEL